MGKIRIGRADLHMWEEPCISGEHGSGAIFFTGCNLGCVFCQNYKISRGDVGHIITCEELADNMLMLQDKGANNINLVTAGHFMAEVVPAIDKAKQRGLTIPIVYNTSSYESVDAIKALDGIVDVYLPDLKYYSSELSKKYSGKSDYFEVAAKAIQEMVRQTREISFVKESDISKRFAKNLIDENGSINKAEYMDLCEQDSYIMQQGTIVRHLLLPGCIEDSKNVIEYLLESFGDDIFISIMNQYTPMPRIKDDYPELFRKITDAEYEEVLDFAIEKGLNYGFFQDGDVAEESFIPDFE